MGQIKFMVNILMVMLFVVSITTFAILFGVDNESRLNLNDDPDFNPTKEQLKNDVDTFYIDINTSAKAFGETTIKTQTDATEGGTAFKVGPKSLVGSLSNVIQTPFKKIFGPDFNVFITAFISLLGGLAFLYAWKTWKGNPD